MVGSTPEENSLCGWLMLGGGHRPGAHPLHGREHPRSLLAPRGLRQKKPSGSPGSQGKAGFLWFLGDFKGLHARASSQARDRSPSLRQAPGRPPAPDSAPAVSCPVAQTSASAPPPPPSLQLGVPSKMCTRPLLQTPRFLEPWAEAVRRPALQAGREGQVRSDPRAPGRVL